MQKCSGRIVFQYSVLFWTILSSHIQSSITLYFFFGGGVKILFIYLLKRGSTQAGRGREADTPAEQGAWCGPLSQNLGIMTLSWTQLLNWLSHLVAPLLFFFFKDLLRERESMPVLSGRAEREGERNSTRFCTEHRASSHNPGITTWAKTRVSCSTNCTI